MTTPRPTAPFLVHFTALFDVNWTKNRAVAAPARWGYSMRMPEIAREITSSWICSVPSKMS
jgi:hypothetical protein